MNDYNALSDRPHFANLYFHTLVFFFCLRLIPPGQLQ
mgnify:CR=1 FL=1